MYDRTKDVQYDLSQRQGRYFITFYRLRLELPGPQDKLWIHDFNPVEPDVATISVVTKSIDEWT